MSYTISILRRAQKELARLPIDIYEQIHIGIHALAQNPRPTGCLKLRDRQGWRIRSGSHRIIYTIDDEKKVVTVLHIGHRRDVYR